MNYKVERVYDGSDSTAEVWELRKIIPKWDRDNKMIYEEVTTLLVGTKSSLTPLADYMNDTEDRIRILENDINLLIKGEPHG